MIKFLPFLLLLVACSTVSKRRPALSDPFQGVDSGNVFASYENLQIDLDADLATLFKEKSGNVIASKKKKIPGTISYLDANQNRISIPVEIRMKGFSTIFYCPFPKLELSFKNKNTENTIFAKTKSVDMNTHCSELNDANVPDSFKFSYYNHREALLYRFADVLKIPTFRTRSISVHYLNSNISGLDPAASYQAFFVEDMGNMKKRLNAREIKGVNDPFKQSDVAADPDSAVMFQFANVLESPKLDREDVARIALFQSLIRNSDWFIKVDPDHMRAKDSPENLWNIKMIENATGSWVAFPQDFGLAGSLMENEFGPSFIDEKTLSVVDKDKQSAIKQSFFDKKQELYDLIAGLKEDPAGQKNLTDALNTFFRILPNF